VKPVDFDYAAPEKIEEVLSLLGTWGGRAKILAGGQSLIPLLVARSVRPEFVIDINRLPGLDYLVERDGGLALGATVRQAEAERSPLLSSVCPLLQAALAWVAVPQVRNLGTIVGSLAQRNAISEIPTVAAATGARLTVLDRGGNIPQPRGPSHPPAARARHRGLVPRAAGRIGLGLRRDAAASGPLRAGRGGGHVRPG
jgi:carbon-monoxide dehydrogenase medium subunit